MKATVETAKCPAWCTRASETDVHTHVNAGTMPVSLHEPAECKTAAEGGTAWWIRTVQVPAELVIEMHQVPGDDAPKVSLFCTTPGSVDHLELTLPEVAALVERLQGVLALGEAGR